MLERGWTSFLMQIILKLVRFCRATISNAKSVHFCIAFRSGIPTMYCKILPYIVLLLSFFLSKCKHFQIESCHQPCTVRSEMAAVCFFFLPQGELCMCYYFIKFVHSAWAQVCKNTRSICASVIKSTKQRSLDWGSQLVLLSTIQSEQNLWWKLSKPSINCYALGSVVLVLLLKYYVVILKSNYWTL